ncbi:MAG: FitA-like ribbon-helix-helix domain-containing protein [Gemmatimonadota bacterium]
MIQIRNVPGEIHRKVKARAALEGLSMSEFALRELRKAIARPSRDDLLRRIEAEPRAELDPQPAEVIRAERDAR